MICLFISIFVVSCEKKDPNPELSDVVFLDLRTELEIAQKNLIELLAMIINNTNSQIIITTHSPYILSVINNLIFAQSVRSLIEEHSNEEFDTIKFQENSLIEPSKFQAYGLHVNENGGFKSIFDTKTQLIGENYLDEISQIVGSEFNEMFEVYKQLKPHKRARK